MQRRNMGLDSGCEMCGNCPSESTLHLLFLCPKAVEVWYEMSAKLGYRLLIPSEAIQKIWTESREQLSKEKGKEVQKGMEFLFCMYMLAYMEKKEREDIQDKNNPLQDAGRKDCY